MATLKQILRIGTTLLVCSGLASPAWAGGACMRQREAMALKAAAIQQQLMVAALSCRQTQLYNHFVVAYRSDLRKSDADLRHYFERRDGRRGIAAYHAYKTKLANAASLDSLHNITGYCAKARATFGTAAELERTSLTEFVAAIQPGSDMTSCHGTRVASRSQE